MFKQYREKTSKMEVKAFHTLCDNASLSKDNAVAAGHNGMVFTARPMCPKDKITLRSTGEGSLVLWVTELSPQTWVANNKPFMIKSKKAWGIDLSSGKTCSNTNMGHCKAFEDAFGENFELSDGNLVSMCITQQHSLSVSINGREIEHAIENLPDKPLFGAIRMSMQKIEIIPSGEEMRQGSQGSGDSHDVIVLMTQDERDQHDTMVQCCLESKWKDVLGEMVKTGYGKYKKSGIFKAKDGQEIKLSFLKGAHISFPGDTVHTIKFQKTGGQPENLLLNTSSGNHDNMQRGQLQITTDSGTKTNVVITIEKQTKGASQAKSNDNALNLLDALAMKLKTHGGLLSKWKLVAKHLGLSQTDVIEIDKSDHKVYNMIQKWIEQNGIKANVSILKEALAKEKLQTAVEIVEREIL